MSYLRNFNKFSIIKNKNYLLEKSNVQIINSRNYSDDEVKEKLKNLFLQKDNKLKHYGLVTSFGIPSFTSLAFTNVYKNLKILPKIDPTFNQTEFLEGCSEAIISFCDLISNKNFEECKDLMTQEAYEELLKRYENAPEQDFEMLTFEKEKIRSRHVLLYRDFKLDDKFYVEATVSFMTKKNEFANVSDFLKTQLLLVRFIRDYTNGSNSDSDWIISYFLQSYSNEIFSD